MKNYYILISVVFFLVNCSKKYNDFPQEDYQSLFPFKGIEKPESGYEDMNIRQCNPEQAVNQYRYPGVILPTNREYEITLKCTFNETESRFSETNTRYQIRYINAEKQLKIIGTHQRITGAEYTLTSGKEYVLKFKAKSGFPMYLSVNGFGERSSWVKAQISAKSTDGLIEIPTLNYEQFQNEDGVVQLKNPYCEYIILP